MELFLRETPNLEVGLLDRVVARQAAGYLYLCLDSYVS